MSAKFVDLVKYYEQGLISREKLLSEFGLDPNAPTEAYLVDNVSLVTQTNIQVGDLVVAQRATKLASSIVDLKNSKWMDALVNIGTSGVVIEEARQDSLVGRSNLRALKVLTPEGPGWTWDGVWAQQVVQK